MRDQRLHIVTTPEPELLGSAAAMLGALGLIAPRAAWERAMALLQSSSATQHEIHILSDLQETEWNHPPLNLRVPRQGTSAWIHRITTPPATKATPAPRKSWR